MQPLQIYVECNIIALMTDSLRDRKKADTKSAIARVAESLFLKNGYQQTTLQQIADEANVSQRTIFAYFPSKESIIFHEHEDKMFEMIQYLKDDTENDTLTSLATFANTQSHTAHDFEKRDKGLRKLIESNRELHEYFFTLHMNLETQLIELLAKERGIAPDSIQAHMIAAILRTSLYHAASKTEAERKADQATVFAFIDAGLTATK